MVLYTCPARTHGANAPIVKHPCGVAAQALDEAGYRYEVKVVGGFKKVPFSRRGKRQEILELTGQEDVPVLITDDRSVVTGTAAIQAWANAPPPTPRAVRPGGSGRLPTLNSCPHGSSRAPQKAAYSGTAPISP